MTVEVFEAVRTVLAVRAYEDKPLPADAIERIVQAAHLSGSSRNGQPWHFVAVDDRETLDAMAERAPSGPYLREAPLAVAVAVEESPYALADTGRAIQSMILTAWSEGIGSNWVGFQGSLDAVNEVIGLPSELQLVAIISFGYPTARLGKGKKNRRPFDEVVHRGRYGVPFTQT